MEHLVIVFATLAVAAVATALLLPLLTRADTPERRAARDRALAAELEACR